MERVHKMTPQDEKKAWAELCQAQFKFSYPLAIVWVDYDEAAH